MSLENANVRWIPLDGAANARVVVPGVLLRSDNLQSLTARDVGVLVEREALEVVLDLRTDVEVAAGGSGADHARAARAHRAPFAVSAVGGKHGSRRWDGQPVAADRRRPVAG